MKLKDKVVVVTGAGSGIGRELVKALLARGSRVAAVDLRPEGLASLAEEVAVGERLSQHTVDIADRDAVFALPDAVLAAHGQVDGVLNNAGIIQPFVKVADLGFDAIERTMNVNFYGTVYLIKAFLPHLLQRPSAHIANVSSMGAFLPVPGQAVYGASKAAVKLMTEGLYAELLDTNVRVTCVMPGAIDTNIAANSGVEIPGGDAAKAREEAPMKPLPAPEAAQVILDGIEHDAFHVLAGNDAKLMFLASRVSPRRATHFIQRQMKSLLGE